MSFTEKEMEELYAEMQKKAMTDPDFRERLLEDTDAALEELAGQPLPAGCHFKVIENDPAYTATFVLPDLISDEFSPEDLDDTAGGYSALLIVSACAAAVSTAACAGDACAAKGCVADMVCAGNACAAQGGTL